MPRATGSHGGAAAIVFLCATVAVLGALKLSVLAGGDLRGAEKYATMAGNLVRSGIYSIDGHTPTADRVPAYTVLVAGTMLVAGSRWSPLLILVQGLLSIVIGILWYRTARRVSSSRWIPPAVVATYACHVTLQWEHLTLRETALFGLLVATFFYLASCSPLRRGPVCAMTAVCALAYYTRATGFLMTIPLIVVIVAQRDWSIASRTRGAALAVGAVVLAALPWQVYQSVITGEVVLLPTPVGGTTLYKGNAITFDRVAPYVDVDRGDAFIRALAARGLDEPDGPRRVKRADDRLASLAWRDIASDPARFVRKSALRVMAYLSPLTTPLGTATVVDDDGQLQLDDYRGDLVGASASWMIFARHASSFFIVLFAIPLGLLALFRHLASPSRPFALAALSFIAANLAMHAVTAAETRYRLYLDPLLILWAWIAVEDLCRPRA